jgi:hypothetical protein
MRIAIPHARFVNNIMRDYPKKIQTRKGWLWIDKMSLIESPQPQENTEKNSR